MSSRPIAAALPTSLPFGNTNVALWTYAQLERLSRANLKQRALDLRDTFGADKLPPLRAQGRDIVIAWIITVQVMLGESQGLGFTAADWGLPDAVGEAEELYFGPRPGHEGYIPPPTPQQPPLEQFQQDQPPRAMTPRSALSGADEAMYAALDAAHTDAVAAAKAARAKNQGSFSFSEAPPPARPYQVPPSGPAAPPWAPPSDARPGTANSFASEASMAAHNDAIMGAARNRARNAGSFVFG